MVGFFDDWDYVSTARDFCGQCGAEGERTQEYNHMVNGYVEVFECPDCGHKVVTDNTVTNVDGEEW